MTIDQELREVRRAIGVVLEVLATRSREIERLQRALEWKLAALPGAEGHQPRADYHLEVGPLIVEVTWRREKEMNHGAGN